MCRLLLLPMCCACCSVMSDSLLTPWTVSHQAALSMGILQARILECVAMPSSRGSSQPRDQTQVSYIPGGFFTSEPPGKPKNTGVGSLSLLQENFLTQELNQGLLHCRQILYQLGYQGSPCFHLYLVFTLFWLITETIFYLLNTWQSMKHYHIHLLFHLCLRKAPQPASCWCWRPNTLLFLISSSQELEAISGWSC